jgi:hypothetical protein
MYAVFRVTGISLLIAFLLSSSLLISATEAAGPPGWDLSKTITIEDRTSNKWDKAVANGVQQVKKVLPNKAKIKFVDRGKKACPNGKPPDQVIVICDKPYKDQNWVGLAWTWTERGYIVSSRIFISDYDDGSPTWKGGSISYGDANTVVHELGHAIGFPERYKSDPDCSVMALGSLRTTYGPCDKKTVRQIYGSPKKNKRNK